MQVQGSLIKLRDEVDSARLFEIKLKLDRLDATIKRCEARRHASMIVRHYETDPMIRTEIVERKKIDRLYRRREILLHMLAQERHFLSDLPFVSGSSAGNH
jgi:hypothetical protein